MVNYPNGMRYTRNGCGTCQNYVMNQPQPRSGNCNDGCISKECTKHEEPICMKREEKDPMEQIPLAMAYVKCQKWRKIYDETKGFQRGTLFEELDKPFLGRGGCNR